MIRTFFHPLVFIASLLLAAGAAAQGKYAPFTVDGDHVIHLNTASPSVRTKYEAVFSKHGRDVSNASDWDGVIQQIVGEKDTDLLMEGTLTMDVNDNEFVAEASADEQVTRFMKAVRPTLGNVQQLDEFLTKLDLILKKK